jgi:flagellar FliL protein
MKSKILIIGLPLFIVQLVVVYFITANILLSQNHNSEKKAEQTEELKTENNSSGEHKNDEKKNEEPEKKDEKKSSGKSVGDFLFTLDDVICNPAESNGKVLVLTSIGFDMNNAESKKVMEEKTVILKDVVISSIARKTVSELNNVAKRDSLKTQIIQNIESKIPNVKINDLYFSKFIIQ